MSKSQQSISKFSRKLSAKSAGLDNYGHSDCQKSFMSNKQALVPKEDMSTKKVFLLLNLSLACLTLSNTSYKNL